MASIKKKQHQELVWVKDRREWESETLLPLSYLLKLPFQLLSVPLGEHCNEEALPSRVCRSMVTEPKEHLPHQEGRTYSTFFFRQ